MPNPFSKINLLPKDSFEFSNLGKFLKWSLTTGRVLVVLTEFVVILAFASRFYYDKKLNDLTEITEQKQAVIGSYVDIEKQARAILEKQKIVDKFLTKNIRFSERMTQIKRITPPDVTYTQIGINVDNISLAGRAGSETSLANVVAGIGTLPQISDVNISTIDFDQKTGLVNFKLVAVIEQPKT